MDTEHDIAQDVSQYLLARPYRPMSSRRTSGRPGGGTARVGRRGGEELPDEAGSAACLRQPRGSRAGIWRTVEPVVKQEISAKERYDKLNGIPIEQIASQVDEILTPLVAAVTARLPAALKFLAPILGVLRKLIANIIATELRQAAINGWAAYCGLPANG